MTDSEVFAVLQEEGGLSLAEIGTGRARRHRTVPAGPPPPAGSLHVRAWRHAGGYTVATNHRASTTPLSVGDADGDGAFRSAPGLPGQVAEAAECQVLSDGAAVAVTRPVAGAGQTTDRRRLFLLRRGAAEWENVPLPDDFRVGGAFGASAGDFVVHGVRWGAPAGAPGDGATVLLRVRTEATGTPLAAPLPDFTAWGRPRLPLRDRIFPPADDPGEAFWSSAWHETGADPGSGLVLGTTMSGDLDETLYAVDFRNRSWALANSPRQSVVTARVSGSEGIRAVTDGGDLWSYHPAHGAPWRRSGTLRKSLHGLAAQGATGGGPIPRHHLRVTSAAYLADRLVVTLARAGEGGPPTPVEAVVATTPDGTDPQVLYRAAPDGPRLRCLVEPTS
ncbi:hypothetical protein ACGFT2_27115 [Streptomyces sp. NPDC048514]|uniref:hypothetical protein n=1 Tax=Streptomyces sp. NPDC048514 TaxID=3365564 RepID=UPI00371DF204